MHRIIQIACLTLACSTGIAQCVLGQEVGRSQDDNSASRATEDADRQFSGPQVGERLPTLKGMGVYGEKAGDEVLAYQKGDTAPQLIVFFHKRTRPAFGLTNAVARHANTLKDSGIKSTVVYLTDDPPSETDWLSRVKRLLPPKTTHVVSSDGLDGPGSYGLNRNMILTVLVAKEGKVTANFALTQPSMNVDAPRVLKAIAEATGTEPPSLASLEGMRRPNDTARMRRLDDPKFTGMLREMINKEASEEEVNAAVKKIEAYVAENNAAKKELARIVHTIVGSGRLKNYGTQPAQDALKAWSEKLEKP